MIKKASIIALAFSILVSGGAYAETKTVDTAATEIDWEYSFKDEKVYLEDLKVNKEDMKELEKLFNQALALDKKGDYEASMKKWDAYNNILSKYIEDSYYLNWEMEREFLKDNGLDNDQLMTLEKLFNEANKDNSKWAVYQERLEKMLPDLKAEVMTFASETDWLKELNVSAGDMTDLEKIFNAAVKLDQDGKYDEGNTKWDSYYKILDKYNTTTCVAYEINWEDEASWLKDLGLKDTQLTKLKTMFEDAKKDDAKWKLYKKALEDLLPDEFKSEAYSFDQEKEWLKELKITADDMTALEKLFNEAVKLEEAGKYDTANEKWDAYYDLLNKYEATFTLSPAMEIKWEDEKTWLKDLSVKADDLTKLETLFNEAIKLDSQGKYDASYEKWDAYNSILEQYLDEFEAFEIMD